MSANQLNPVQINAIRIQVNKKGMLVLDRYIKMDDKDSCLRLLEMTIEDVKKHL